MSARIENEKEVCESCKPGYWLETKDNNKVCTKIEGIANCSNASKTGETLTCSACLAGYFLDTGKCTEVTDKITGCVSYSKVSDTLKCTACGMDYFEKDDKCHADKIKTMCLNGEFNDEDNQDKCKNNCAVSRGYYAVNAVKKDLVTYQICEKGKGSHTKDDPSGNEGKNTMKIVFIFC